MKHTNGLKIAIVADWLTNRGGAEHVVEALAAAFPAATVYTSVYNKALFPKIANRLRGTWLQRLPVRLREKHQWLLPLLPSAFFRLDLSAYDVILSSSSAFAKCLTLRTDQRHICYCHTPTRYLYHAESEYKSQYKVPMWMRPLKHLFWNPLMGYLRKMDQKGAATVTDWVANSDFVGQRILKFYGKTSQTVYPCVNIYPFIEAATKTQKKNYYLAVGRFIPYKKFDLLVRAFAENKQPLKLVGIGPELEKCKALANALGATNIEFLGFADRAVLPSLYAGAKAFLFPAEEDFGLTPVEAMAAGTPVLYYGVGGATESVVHGCGVAFGAQTPKTLNESLDQLLQTTFQINTLQQNAKRFTVETFTRTMQAIVFSHPTE